MPAPQAIWPDAQPFVAIAAVVNAPGTAGWSTPWPTTTFIITSISAMFTGAGGGGLIEAEVNTGSSVVPFWGHVSPGGAAEWAHWDGWFPLKDSWSLQMAVVSGGYGIVVAGVVVPVASL